MTLKYRAVDAPGAKFFHDCSRGVHTRHDRYGCDGTAETMIGLKVYLGLIVTVGSIVT